MGKASRFLQGKPAARRGRKARDLFETARPPAPIQLDRSKQERDTDSEVALKMSAATPHRAPLRGRIRWIALAAGISLGVFASAAPAATPSDPALARLASHH